MNSNGDDIERQKQIQLIRKRLLFMIFFLVLGCAVLLYVTTFIETERTFLGIIIFAIGNIGGFVSIQQRISKAEVDYLKEISTSWSSLLLFPLVGGILALLLHLLFLSGIIEGALFPHYDIPETSNGNHLTAFQLFLLKSFPNTVPDIAKLFVWSFIAGFSERFVLQIIEQTAKKVRTDDNSVER